MSDNSMTPDKDALQALLDKVEARDDPTHQEFMKVAIPAFQYLPALLYSKHNASRAWTAFFGSLSAAKTLHDAVLRGACWRINWMPHGVTCRILRTGADTVYATHPSDPARAWLCAILKALIAEASE